jgi:predicted permease
MPDWRIAVRDRLVSMRMNAPAEQNLVEEIAQHLEDHFRELRGGGMGEAEAYRKTIAELDDLYPLSANLERSQTMPKYDTASAAEGLWKDLRYAARNMRRNPLFVAFVVMTLALGIGANTTVFSLIDTILLNPLPVPNPSSLSAFAAVDERQNSKSATLLPVSYADLKDYQARNEVFESLAGFTSARGLTLQEHGESQAVFGELVTANYFSTLGLIPARGRFFAPDEDGTPGAHPVAVLNYAAWQQRFGGAEDIVGRQIRVNNVVLTVIGVAPPHFIGMNSIFGPDLWTPAAMADQLFPNSLANALTDRSKAAFLGVGRLKPQVTLPRAQANISTIAAALAQTYKATDEGRSAAVRPIREVLVSNAGSSASAMAFGAAALFLVVGIVLLIACSNVANLLMARSASRHQEMAVRLAMGASRYRLVRQLLTESVLLGLFGGAAGLGVGWVGLQLLFGRLPGSANFPTPKLDATVLLFSLAVSLATGFLFGLMPAVRSSRTNVADALKEMGRTAGRSRRRVSIANALLVGQVAFSFLLLVTAALFLRSIGRAYGMDPGFQTAHLAVFPANPGQAGMSKVLTQTFYRDVRDRVAAMPGVAAVSWSSNMPLWARSGSGLQVEGQQARSRADQVRAVFTTVDRDYFDVAGIAVESGRGFTRADSETSAPVAVVNEKLAHDYWPDGAVGKRVQVPGESVWRLVIGVAKTANYTGWGEAPQDCVYLPMAQNFTDSMVLYVRSQGDPRSLLAPVERELHAAAPQVLIFGTRTGSEIIDGGLFQARMGVGLLTVFGLLALGLASIGLYGVLAYSVNLRKREIGLRMALGATRGSVLALVLREGMLLVTIGVTIGFAAALSAGRLLRTMLFGIDAADPISVAGAALMLSAVALLACYLPARRATRVDPLEALREA